MDNMLKALSTESGRENWGIKYLFLQYKFINNKLKVWRFVFTNNFWIKCLIYIINYKLKVWHFVLIAFSLPDPCWLDHFFNFHAH
jgi:hypothetical protein